MKIDDTNLYAHEDDNTIITETEAVLELMIGNDYNTAEEALADLHNCRSVNGIYSVNASKRLRRLLQKE